MKRFILVLALSCLSQVAFAISSQEAFEILKTSKVNYEPIGAVCEQVAQLELAEEFTPDKYEMIVGIEYADSDATRGELDVVIFDKATKKVAVSAEVKCWKSFEGAKKKATEQRNRFIKYINSGYKMYFKSKEYRFERWQFEDIRQFLMVSQSGGKKRGFDRELEMSLDQLMELRKKLLECKAYRKCG